MVPETLLSKLAKRNAEVFHTQASSHGSCSGEHDRSSTVNKVASYHHFRSSFSLWICFPRGCLLSKKILHIALGSVSNCSDFPFQLRWCFPEFVVSSSKVMKSKVTYFTCPAVCFQSPVSLNTEGIKVPAELLPLQFQVSLQPPLQGTLWATFTSFCSFAAFLLFANSCD